MQRTGAQIVWECLVKEGVDHRVRLPGRRDPADLRRHARLPDPPRAGAPRAGRRAHGRRLRARERQGRRRDRHLRARAPPTWSPASPPRCWTPSPIVFITGQVSSQGARQRRLPGDRRHRHHAADHQAQLAGDRRAPTSRARMREAFAIARAGRPGPGAGRHHARTRSRPRPSSTTPRRVHLPGLHEPEPPDAREPRARGRADRQGRAAADPGRPRRHPLGRDAGARRVRREDRTSRWRSRCSASAASRRATRSASA